MDNNNPIQPTIQPEINPSPMGNPAPIVPPQTTDPTSKGSNKLVLWFIVGIVVIILLVGGVYLFLSQSQQKSTNSKPQPIITQQTPAPTPEENLENDLNNVDASDASDSADFAPVDQDLQNL